MSILALTPLIGPADYSFVPLLWIALVPLPIANPLAGFPHLCLGEHTEKFSWWHMCHLLWKLTAGTSKSIGFPGQIRACFDKLPITLLS